MFYEVLNFLLLDCLLHPKIDNLEISEPRIIGVTTGVTAPVVGGGSAACVVTPVPARWSVVGCADHVVATAERVVAGLGRRRVVDVVGNCVVGGDPGVPVAVLPVN